MKQIFFIFLCGFFYSISFSQAVISKPVSAASRKTIKDFGAIPNDGKDDTWAFIKAGKYFSNLWDVNGVPLKPGKVNFSYASYSALLEIPSGTYLAGKQINVPAKGLSTTYGGVFGNPAATTPIIIPEGSAYRTGLELILLSNKTNDINQVIIKGTGTKAPIIKYNDDLALGYFNNKGEGQLVNDATYSPKYILTIGSFIQTENCKNIRIENIEIDGNNIPATEKKGTTLYKGGFIGHGIQMGANGTYFLNTKNVSLYNLNIHHMTLDGIVFQDYYKDPALFPNQPLSNLSIENTICNYNRRQGFSWVGGRGIKVVNSKFNNTGKTTSGVAAGNPAAGLDIEPEQSADGSYLWCIDGKFIKCDFINNTGTALGNDLTGHRTKTITFDSCVFHDVDGFAVWVKGKGITFNNCKIWGGFIHGNEGLSAEDATSFNNCDFADEEIPGLPGVYNKGYALVESISRRMRFNNCTFRTLHADQRLINISTPSIIEQEFNVFSDCNFTVGPNSNGSNIMFGCVFDKNNKITSKNINQAESIGLNAIVFTGSTNSLKPYSFKSEGNILLSVANSNGRNSTQFTIGRNGIGSKATDGFTNFYIGPGSCLYAFWDQVIDIGKNSSFVNMAGGQFAMLSGSLNNNGKIILEDESSTAFYRSIAINTGTNGKPQFYYHKKAKMAMNAFWSKALAGLGPSSPMSSVKLSANTRFDGGNVGIPAGRSVANK